MERGDDRPAVPQAAADAAGAGGDSAADHAYFQAIEKTFIRLRGAPLLLSPADWRVARDWHRRGVPLELVEHTLEEIFARRREREAKRPISSLRYCARAVEAAWEERRELTAAGERGEAEPLEVEPRLRALAAALPTDLPARERWAERLLALAPTVAEAGEEGVERALAALDAELLAAVEESLAPERRSRLETTLEATFAELLGRLPRDKAEEARARLRHQALRREAGLPLLSLFAPEAEARGDDLEGG